MSSVGSQVKDEAKLDKAISDHNLIINYLPQNLTNEELTTLFSRVGPVKMAKVVRNRYTGNSYGFGFVEYENEADAQKAIESLNGLQLQNKRIKVAAARQGDNLKGANLYIRYLPKNFFAKDLEELFGNYGTVVSSRVLMDNATGVSRGIGFVLFSSRDEATTAKEALDGRAPPGGTQALSVKFAEENKVLRQPQPAVPVAPVGLYRPVMPIPAAVPPVLPQLPPLPSAVPLSAPVPSASASRLSMIQKSLAVAYQDGFGEGYQNEFVGGPIRSTLATQRLRAMRYRPIAPSSALIQTPDEPRMLSPAIASTEEHVLFVYNIGSTTDERELWQLFSPYGAIKKVNVVRDYEKKQGKGYGFVTMFDYQEALNAIQQLNGFVFTDKPLQVSLKTPKK